MVIDNNVNGSSNCEIFDVCELHGFIHNTLTGKCSISVQQNGDDTALILRTNGTIIERTIALEII